MIEAFAPDRGFEPLPPHDSNAEQCVLGSMLCDPAAIEYVIPILAAQSFYHPRNRDLYFAMLALHDRGEPIDIEIVSSELARTDMLDRVGGDAYLGVLIMAVPTSAHVESYARIVQRTYVKRQLIRAAGKIAAIGYEDADEEGVDLARAEAELFQVTQSVKTNDFVDLKDEIEAYLENIQVGGTVTTLTGVPTGFTDLDMILGGMQESDLVVLAARPSVGKTALALSIAQNVAVQHSMGVLIFSLEMSKKQLTERLLCSTAMVDSARLRQGRLSHTDFERIEHAYMELSEARIVISDNSDLSVQQLRSQAKRIVSERAISLIIIDYIQLLEGSNARDGRTQEVSEISRKLKALARELGVPVLVLSQLNRSVESRHPHIPMLSDLRESGAIEQDADVVLMIYREEMYDRDSEKKGIAEIHIAKHRNGPTGIVSLHFNESSTRFRNLDHWHSDHDSWSNQQV